MHAEAGMLFPYLQAFPPELPYHFHPMEEELLCRLQTSSGHLPPLNSPTRNMVKTPTVSDYDLGGEGDLFKAPEPIVEEPAMVLDHVAAAMWMISNGDAVISTNTFEVPDVDPIQNEQLLIDAVISTNTFGIPDVDPIQNEQLLIDAFYESSQPGEFPTRGEEEKPDEGIKKSVSSGSLESSTGVSGASAGPNLCAAKGIISGDVLVMRRACSEGDLQTYSNGGGMSFSGSTIHLPFERLLSVGEEDRRQKLSRYRKKKTKRNFGRKIKYACRKALADSQPRVRGRFAKTEDPEPPASSKPVSPVPINM